MHYRHDLILNEIGPLLSWCFPVTNWIYETPREAVHASHMEDVFAKFFEAEHRDIAADVAFLTSSAKNASGFLLFEGLPHPTWEPDLLKSELQDKDAMEIHGYPFYRASLQICPKDEVLLKVILGDSCSYRPFGGEKLCGGFHPDFSLSWKHDTHNFFVHVCFGCHEFKSFCPGHQLRTDVTKSTLDKLQTILRKYRCQRPWRELPLTGLKPLQEQILRDMKLYNQLGHEDPENPCKSDGCSRGAITNSTFCRMHHFEQIQQRPCPFDH